MPELPEVETIVNDLRNKIINKKIVNVEVRNKTTVRGDVAKFKKMLKGDYFGSIERRAKLMVIRFGPPPSLRGATGGSTFSPHQGEIQRGLPSSEDTRGSTEDGKPHPTLPSERGGGVFFLLIHLKMTGQLIYYYDHKVIAGGHNLPLHLPKLPDKHTHVILTLADRSRLFFNDQRRFGFMKIVDEEERNKIMESYGMEPLSKAFTLKKFKETLKGKRAIKQILMDQERVAGIGNIYSDEICFCARVRPDRKVNTLAENEIKSLRSCVKKILKLAIKYRGTTFKDYKDVAGRQGNFSNFLKVYDREGEKCMRCDAVLQKKRLGGRGSVFCSSCQH